ncbi:MAG TPA: 4Fe-4S dicluster domain-containing protein [Sediminispirochaeta sp.]|nr:4Fe-4S dicluster domain-containing protein [Sediminispirochaeta sp.]
MKEIVVISGKGGTGKTSLTASFAVLAGGETVVADCDVDAADMHLLLEPDFSSREEFFSGEVAVIDPDICTNCGICRQVCRFDAISVSERSHIVAPLSCEGCGYCARVCPVQAISNNSEQVGELYVSSIKTDTKMVHAALKIGADNSGKLVARVKNEAKSVAEELGKAMVLVDGSPGIGCPVVSSLSGASFVVLVTEPTVSGLHDLKRVYQLVKKFKIPAGCVVNKADLNPQILQEIETLLQDEQIHYLAKIPYNEEFTAAMTNGKTVVEWDQNLRQTVSETWQQVLKILESETKE